MGSSQSRGRQERPLTVNHPRFKNSKTLTTGNIPLMQTDLITDEPSYQRWRTSTAQLKQEKYRFLLLPLRHGNLDGCEVCSSRRTITVTYERYPFLLSDAIETNKRKKAAFEESQLWQLLYAICCAEEEYASIVGSQAIGNISPQAIFISQKGKIRVANPFSWPEEPKAHPKAQSVYLPPQEIQDLRRGIKNTRRTAQSSQQYSIGLTVLSAGILKQNSDLYCLQKMTFETAQANRRINFWLTRQRYSQTLRIVVAHLCNYQPSRRCSIGELRSWMGQYRARIGANQFKGEGVELPERFGEEVRELRLNASYLGSEVDKQDYVNQYHFGYKAREVLKEIPSVLQEVSESKMVQQSSALNPKKTISPKKEPNVRNDQTPNKVELSAYLPEFTPKRVVEADKFEGSLESKHTIQSKSSQVLNNKNRADDSATNLQNIQKTQSRIIYQQQPSIPNYYSKSEPQAILQSLVNPESAGNTVNIKNEANISQIAAKLRLGCSESSKQQYIPMPSPSSRNQITFNYTNVQQTTVKIPLPKTTQTKPNQSKQIIQQFANSNSNKQKDIQNKSEDNSNKEQSAKPSSPKEEGRGDYKLKNSRSHQSINFINSSIKEPAATKRATKLSNSKSIPSNIAAKQSPNSYKVITIEELTSKINAQQIDLPANDSLRRSAIDKLTNEINNQIKNQKRQSKVVVVVNDNQGETSKEDKEKLEIVQDKAIDCIIKYQQNGNERDFPADKTRKIASKITEKQNESVKSASSKQSTKNHKLANTKIRQTEATNKQQKPKEQAIKPHNKHRIQSPKSITLLSNNSNADKKSSVTQLPTKPQPKINSNPLPKSCSTVGQYKNPAHHHIQHIKITQLRPEIELPACHEQQSNIKIKSVKEIQPSRVVKSKVDLKEQEKIYINQVPRTEVVSYIQEVKIYNFKHIQESAYIQENIHNQEAQAVVTQVPSVEQNKIQVQPIKQTIKQIQDTTADITAHIEEPNLAITQMKPIKQPKVVPLKVDNIKIEAQTPKSKQTFPIAKENIVKITQANELVRQESEQKL